MPFFFFFFSFFFSSSLSPPSRSKRFLPHWPGKFDTVFVSFIECPSPLSFVFPNLISHTSFADLKTGDSPLRFEGRVRTSLTLLVIGFAFRDLRDLELVTPRALFSPRSQFLFYTVPSSSERPVFLHPTMPSPAPSEWIPLDPVNAYFVPSPCRPRLYCGLRCVRR